MRTWFERSRRSSAAPLLALAAAFLSAGCNDGNGVGADDPVLGIALVAEGLTAPVTLVESPDETDRLFVVDQAGQIRVIAADGTLLPTPFLDLSGSIVALNPNFDERGLLGLAFHPQYATNGRFFVYYSAPSRPGTPQDYNHTSVISEFQVSGSDADVADPASERVLLEVPQPQANHNAGTVAFGPDDFLYISLGDGGGGDDVGLGHVEDWYEANEGGNGQDVEANLLGSILRIDVDTGDPYGIPSDNPFVGEAGLDEIYAYGFRNPYRFSFDQASGALLVGDAGQELYEEVSFVERGGNYGWNVKEGTHCFNTDDPDTSRPSCPGTGEFDELLVDPVVEYENAKDGDGVGIVVVGGHVYRGTDIPGLGGVYVFGDFSTSFESPDGLVLVALPVGAGMWPVQEARFGRSGERLGAFVLGFGQDLDGEVYVLTSQTGTPTGTTGRVHRLVLE